MLNDFEIDAIESETRLKEAKLLYNSGFHEAVLNRAYYGVYSVANAILTLLGYESKTNGGLRRLLGYYVIESGVI